MKLYHLTKPQQSIWNMEQYYGRSIANITGSVRFNELISISALQAALNKTVEQCNSLRIRIKTQDGTPMQFISAFESSEFEIVCFKSKSEFDLWIQSLAWTSFDLGDKLYKIFIVTIDNQLGIVFHLHHLTADAWTLSMLANTVMKNLKEETVSINNYLDYLSAEQEYEVSARYQKDKTYFLYCFQQCSEPVYLSDKRTKTIESKRLSFIINTKSTAEMQAFCTKTEVTPYVLFMNALAVYVYRLKGAQNLYIGTTVLNRMGRKEKETAGIFVNTVPVLFHVEENKSVLENVRSNAENISGVFRHQKYQYNDLLKDIREQYSFTDRLFDVMLNYQNAALDDNDMTAEWHFCGCQSESLCIHINDRQHEGAFHLDYDYQMELFNQSDIERMHNHLLNLIFDIIKNPAQKPQDLKLLSESEYQKVIYDFNDTVVDYPVDKCIHQLFEEQVELTPDAVAVVFENEKYTYRQINDMANSLAHILRSKGIGRNDIVAIIAKRSYKVIVAQFAVLKAGGAYLPIDPNYPEDRINFMLDDAKCKVVLTLDAAVHFDGKIDMENDALFLDKPVDIKSINTPDDLCYLIYTSGSTGMPKGVMLPHQNVSNYCSNNKNNIIPAIMTSEAQLIVAITTISFDSFVIESLLALLNGKRIIFANTYQSSDQNALNQLLLKEGGDVLQTTPSKMQLLMANENQNTYLENLKMIILGGESLDKQVVEQLRKHTNAKIFNAYGPTETTVCSTIAPIKTAEKRVHAITIGKPIANTQIYILDKYLHPLPIGTVGELCITGAGVGKGYLNRPELTAEKFIENPFGNGKMYKTGDLARWREDGNIEYIGRMDHQVKIRGLRIELGEIENVIGQCNSMKQCAVVVKSDENGRQYICAYYIGREVNIKEVRAMLAKKLPQYMIPHFFIKMDRFPTTPSGKTDRKMFPAPDFANIKSDTEYMAPITKAEKAIASLIERVLGVQEVGMNDNFFDIGGDSLKAIEFVTKAHHEGLYFTLQDVFNQPTAMLLVKHMIDGNRRTAPYRVEDFSELHLLLENNSIDVEKSTVKQDIGDVLITGATGWLGAHILDEFLMCEAGVAYCLVRGSNILESEKRLWETLNDYFNDKYLNCNRIVVLCGDITEKIALEHPIDTIIHCAANVKHYGSYQHSYDINVGGTKNVVELAKEKGAKLLHISTTSVSGNSFDRTDDFPNTVFDERRLYIEQPLDNIYVRSKFEAEVAVLQARIEGLDAVIIRVGNLANRYSDLKFQRNYHENATLTKLRAFVDLAMFPEEFAGFPIEFSPVDFTATAIIKIAQYFNKYIPVLHAYNHKIIRFLDFVNILQTFSIKMESVSLERFLQAAYDAGDHSESVHIHNAFSHDISEDGNLHLQSNIKLDNHFTVQHLKHIGFEWPDIGLEYLEGYINYFKNIGYWSVVE